MGREVRKVPANWEHPRNEHGHYKPLHGRSFAADLADWEEGAAKWDQGYVQDYSVYPETAWKPKRGDEDCETYADWAGEKPLAEWYMPDWPESERTHFMMYEDTTEGTPISPAFATPEELARWLADTGASAFGGMTATYEEWLNMIVGPGWAVSAVISDGEFRSGVSEASHMAQKNGTT